MRSAGDGRREPATSEACHLRLDDTDVRILDLLQANPRSPVSQVARQVGLTDNAVRYRIRRMQQAGVIREFVLVVDQRLMGRPTLHLVLLRLRDPGALGDLLQHVPESCGGYLCEGEFNACIFVCAGDEAELQRVLERLPTMAAVDKVVPLIVRQGLRGAPVPLAPSPLGMGTRDVL